MTNQEKQDDSELEQVMLKEWEAVRKSFYYPQLPQPKISNTIPNGRFDMQSLEIEVNGSFVRSFKQHGIEEADALNEVLSHELTHFMKYPGSVLNILKLQKEARKITGEEKASALRTAFTEAQTIIYQIKEMKHPYTVKMRKVCPPDKNDSLGKLMYDLYQKVCKEDLGIRLGRKERKLVDKLKNINYLDKEKELDSFREFTETLKDYKFNQQEQGRGRGQGSGQGRGLGRFSENQIREGIRQFAEECSNPAEFEEIVKELLKASENEKGSKPLQIQGKGAGTEKGITLLANNFYSALAERYTVPIRKKPMKKNGSLYPYSHNGFSVSDPLSEMDVFSTPGILPGITKKWVRKEGKVTMDCEAVPDSIIVIDSSSSMFNPTAGISIPVLGGTAISTAYLDNDAEVAVYNFSADDIVFGPSKNKERVHKTLRIYQNGGTMFNPSKIENILRGQESADISVISDMDIRNLDAFINTILEIPQTHRVHLLYTQHNSYVERLRQNFGSKKNVAILPLVEEQDIKKIVMGELKKSVR